MYINFFFKVDQIINSLVLCDYLNFLSYNCFKFVGKIDLKQFTKLIINSKPKNNNNYIHKIKKID